MTHPIPPIPASFAHRFFSFFSFPDRRFLPYAMSRRHGKMEGGTSVEWGVRSAEFGGRGENEVRPDGSLFRSAIPNAVKRDLDPTCRRGMQGVPSSSGCSEISGNRGIFGSPGGCDRCDRLRNNHLCVSPWIGTVEMSLAIQEIRKSWPVAVYVGSQPCPNCYPTDTQPTPNRHPTDTQPIPNRYPIDTLSTPQRTQAILTFALAAQSVRMTSRQSENTSLQSENYSLAKKNRGLDQSLRRLG
jgi:hypothetical protein